MANQPDTPALRVAKTHGFGSTEGGLSLVVEIEDQRGTRLTLRIPHQLEGEFHSKFQGASSHAAKARGDELDSKIINALNPTQVDIGTTDEGNIGIRMQLSTGTKMDLTLGDDAILQLREALDQIAKIQSGSGPKKAH